MVSDKVRDTVEYEGCLYYEMLKTDYYDQDDLYEYEERKDNARQLCWRAISESKKKLPTLAFRKQNRHHINVRNRI
jgi:hypothetical protein